jgi:hypothetical protein
LVRWINLLLAQRERERERERERSSQPLWMCDPLKALLIIMASFLFNVRSSCQGFMMIKVMRTKSFGNQILLPECVLVPNLDGMFWKRYMVLSSEGQG